MLNESKSVWILEVFRVEACYYYDKECHVLCYIPCYVKCMGSLSRWWQPWVDGEVAGFTGSSHSILQNNVFNEVLAEWKDEGGFCRQPFPPGKETLTMTQITPDKVWLGYFIYQTSQVNWEVMLAFYIWQSVGNDAGDRWDVTIEWTWFWETVRNWRPLNFCQCSLNDTRKWHKAKRNAWTRREL